MVKLEGIIIKNIIRKLLSDQNYRDEIVALIDAKFLDDLLLLIIKIAEAKNRTKDDSWYKTNMLSNSLSKSDIAWNSGLNLKTISNIYQSGSREIVIKVSSEHFDTLKDMINKIPNTSIPKMDLRIQHNGIDVTLDSKDVLVCINAISVRRAAIRGGAWSTAGKQVEKPLMLTLCKLLEIPKGYYDQKKAPESVREIDFFLFTKDGKPHKCEVKLMGQGNPESADVVDYRDTAILVADRLSDTNKTQLTEKKVNWVAMHDGDTLAQFSKILTKLGIPHTKFKGNLDERLDTVLKDLLG
jgi:hypothetical protein